MLKAIFPVLIADKDDRGFLAFPFQNFGKLSSLPSIKTKQKLVKICVENGIPLTEKAVRRSVKDVIAEITQNQGIKMSDLGAEEVAMGSCEKRVFDKVNGNIVFSNHKIVNTIHFITLLTVVTFLLTASQSPTHSLFFSYC